MMQPQKTQPHPESTERERLAAQSRQPAEATASQRRLGDLTRSPRSPRPAFTSSSPASVCHPSYDDD